MEYFIPGFIFIRLFQILTSRKISKYQILISVAVSYILKAICSVLHSFVFKNHVFPWSARVIILCALSVILAISFVLIVENRKVNSLIVNINHKSIHDDVWQDIIDYDNGTTLRFVCGDTIYIGDLTAHEEKGNDSWFILEDYIVDEPNGKYDITESGMKARIAIPIKNVDRIELFYKQCI